MVDGLHRFSTVNDVFSVVVYKIFTLLVFIWFIMFRLPHHRCRYVYMQSALLTARSTLTKVRYINIFQRSLWHSAAVAAKFGPRTFCLSVKYYVQGAVAPYIDDANIFLLNLNQYFL